MHADARSANVVVVVMAAVCIRAIAVDAFAIADLVAAVCRLLVNAIVMGAARMIQRISQRYGRRSRGPSGKWCSKAASASVLKAYCVRFRRAAPTHCGPQLQATLTAVAFEIVVPRRQVTVPLRTYSIPPCACTRHWSGAAATATRRAPARRRCRARPRAAHRSAGPSVRHVMRSYGHGLGFVSALGACVHTGVRARVHVSVQCRARVVTSAATNTFIRITMVLGYQYQYQ